MITGLGIAFSLLTLFSGSNTPVSAICDTCQYANETRGDTCYKEIEVSYSDSCGKPKPGAKDHVFVIFEDGIWGNVEVKFSDSILLKKIIARPIMADVPY